MTAEQPKPPKAPKTDDGTVTPDNFYADSTPEVPVEKAPTVKPDNFYADGTKQ